MKYKIQYESSFAEPIYASDNADRRCIHTTSDTYDVDSIDDCITIMKDILDVPFAELTLDEVKKDFDDISEDKAVAIQEYYNGRLALYNTAINDLSTFAVDDRTELKYDIPEKYNSFNVTDTYDISQQHAFLNIRKL